MVIMLFLRWDKKTESTECTICTSQVTGEESKQYISSLLETTNPVLVNKGETKTLVRKVSLMSATNQVQTSGLT